MESLLSRYCTWRRQGSHPVEDKRRSRCNSLDYIPHSQSSIVLYRTKMMLTSYALCYSEREN